MAGQTQQDAGGTGNQGGRVCRMKVMTLGGKPKLHDVQAGSTVAPLLEAAGYAGYEATINGQVVGPDFVINEDAHVLLKQRLQAGRQ